MQARGRYATRARRPEEVLDSQLPRHLDLPHIRRRRAPSSDAEWSVACGTRADALSRTSAVPPTEVAAAILCHLSATLTLGLLPACSCSGANLSALPCGPRLVGKHPGRHDEGPYSIGTGNAGIGLPVPEHLLYGSDQKKPGNCTCQCDGSEYGKRPVKLAGPLQD